MTQPTPPAAAEVLAFWRQAGPDKWFAKDEGFDAEIARRFRPLVDAAARGGLSDWEDSPEGVYALLILLDQFPRNLNRGSSHAFAADPLAREVAGRAIARGFEVIDATCPYVSKVQEHAYELGEQGYSVVIIGASLSGGTCQCTM